MCLETLVGDALILPALRFDLSDETDAAENEPNDTVQTAQPLELPSVVNGELDDAMKATSDGRKRGRKSGKPEGIVVQPAASVAKPALKVGK